MKLLIASHICPEAVAELKLEHEVTCTWEVPHRGLIDLLADCEVLIFRSGIELSRQLLSAAPRLRLIVRAGSGLDNLDLDYVSSRAITVTCLPGPGGRAVAELTVGLMLALARQILVADRALRAGHWLKDQLSGALLEGKYLGVVGCGRIGTQVGMLGAALGMSVVGCVATPSPLRASELAGRGIALKYFAEVLETADFLCIHVPLTATTRHIIDCQALGRLKPGSFLCNLARGGVVDESALYAALTTSGRLAGAALDVHAQEGEGAVSPLAMLPNVILTPHIGSTTLETQRTIGRGVISAISAWQAGLPT